MRRARRTQPGSRTSRRPARSDRPRWVAHDTSVIGRQAEFGTGGLAGEQAIRFRDSAFTENRDVPVHRWVPWIAGFSTTFVEDCIESYLPSSRGRRCLILDPFAGVGTTLVTAAASGHDAVGFEINPYAALACRAKLGAFSLDVVRLESCLRDYADYSRNGMGAASGTRPAGFETRIPFFSPAVEKQVYGFLSFLRSIKLKEVADLFRLAFGAVMVSFSNYTYEPSLCSRPGAGKPLIERADVHASILAKLSQMAHDIKWLQGELAGRGEAGKGTVHLTSFMNSRSILAPVSVDLMVTSPPYMNNYHYVRSTRPQLFWLDLVGGRADLRRLETENVGKYWQTVRDAAPVELEFGNPALERLLGDIRRTRSEAQAYGGPGWANYVATYLNDSYRFLEVLKPSLRRGGTAVIVIGNSIIQGHEVKVEHILADMARQLGYAVHGIPLLRTKRVGASITKSAVRRGSTSPASLYECAVILRKR